MESIDDLKSFRDGVVSLQNLKGSFAKTWNIFDKYQISNQTQNLAFEGYLISEILTHSSGWSYSKLNLIHSQIYEKYKEGWSLKISKPKSEKIYFEMIQEYFYLMKIFQNQPPNSIKAQEFVKEVGSVFVKFLYPYLTNQLELKFSGYSRFTKEVGYMLEMANFFKSVSPIANKGHINMILNDGLPRLIKKSFVINEDQRAFANLDSDTSTIEFNFIIVKGILSYGIENIMRTNSFEITQIFN